MGSWLKAFGLLALVVAAPFLVERLLGRNTHLPIGSVSVHESFWHDVTSYGIFGVVVLLVLAFLVVLALFLPQTYEISDYLTLAERDMNALLRGWGGGMSADARKNMVKERAEWLSMIRDGRTDVSDVYKEFFTLNQNDLSSGGPQGGSMGKARLTAFLLRELYEGRVQNAQLKVYNEIKNGGKPYVAPGIRQLIGYDDFDEKTGFPPGSGVGWFPLALAVKVHRHPRNILMVKPDKTVVTNWAVIDELNRQAIPAKA